MDKHTEASGGGSSHLEHPFYLGGPLNPLLCPGWGLRTGKERYCLEDVLSVRPFQDTVCFSIKSDVLSVKVGHVPSVRIAFDMPLANDVLSVCPPE